MDKNKVKIFIATHKKFINRTNSSYIPLYVGKSNKEDLQYLGDDTGDNISSKNANYCELTGLYWMWKNIEVEYIGLCHYRRYFVNAFGFHLKESTVLELLKHYDMILPNKYKGTNSLRYEYGKAHCINDLEILRSIVEKKYPDYLNDFDKIMARDYGYYFNMFISNKELTNQYCEWLFSILFELEGIIDISNYDSYQQRVFGFLSERLMNVWLEHNNLKIKEFPVRDLGKFNFIKFHLRNIYHKIKY